MTLREKQSLFTRLHARLILHAISLGYETTHGYTYRSPEENERIGGHPGSLHMLKLAADLNLFRFNEAQQKWVYLSSTESHRELGEWWEQQHELCRWGGRFGDGNHYSITHGGRK